MTDKVKEAIKDLHQDICDLQQKQEEIEDELKRKTEALQSFCEHNVIYEFPYTTTYLGDYQAPVRMCAVCKFTQHGHIEHPLWYQNENGHSVATEDKAKIINCKERNMWDYDEIRKEDRAFIDYKG